MSQKENELVAIMFADIVDYTAIIQQSESKAKILLEAFQNILKNIVAKFSGEIVNSYGDGCLIKFYSAESALNAAKEIQYQFNSSDLIVPVRIGVHLGDVFSKDGNIYGNNVNIASRIESFAVSGSILFSEETYAQISNKESFEYKDLGKVKFKNDSKIRTLYALTGDKLVIPKRTDLKGKGKLNSKKRLKFLFTVSLSFILVAIYYSYFIKGDNNAYVEKSIAVLPLENLNVVEEGLDYYSGGLTVEIIDELTKVNSFEIISYTQSRYYKNSSKPAKEIAEELGVNYIVSGSIRMLPNENIKLSVELFNPFSNKRIWHEIFENNMEDAQKIQGEIAKQIAEKLNIQLSPEEESNLEKINTVDGEAFKFFLKAKSEMDKFTEHGFTKSREYLNKAIQLDSTYAHAYTLKAWNLLLSYDPQIVPSTSKFQNDLELVSDLIEQSIKLRPDFSDNYLVKSSYSLYARNKIKDAIDDVEYAINIKSWPKAPTNYCTCTMISALVSGHKFERAKEIAKIADKIDPANILRIWDKGIIEIAQGNLVKSEKYFREAYEEEPFEYFRAYLAMALYHLEKYDDLINLYSKEEYYDEKLTTLSLAYLSNAYFKLGNNQESESVLDVLNARFELGNTNIYNSIIYAGREQYRRSMEYFEEAYISNEYGIAVISSIDPIFKSLSKFPKYQEIRKNMQFEN